MSECFESRGGVIVQIVGDSLVTYWKLSDADQAVAAVKRAKIIGAELSDKWRATLPGELVPMHGIDCGPVMRGNFGAQTRLNYAILGDVVNFTMRLCSGNFHLKTQSLFSSRVRALVRNKEELRFRDSIIVKGRANKEDLFTLEDVDPTPTQPENTSS